MTDDTKKAVLWGLAGILTYKILVKPAAKHWKRELFHEEYDDASRPPPPQG